MSPKQRPSETHVVFIAPHLINGFQAANNWEIIIWVTSGLSLSGAILAYFVGEDGPFKLNKAMFRFKSVAKLYRDPGTPFFP